MDQCRIGWCGDRISRPRPEVIRSRKLLGPASRIGSRPVVARSTRSCTASNPRPRARDRPRLPHTQRGHSLRDMDRRRCPAAARRSTERQGPPFRRDWVPRRPCLFLAYGSSDTRAAKAPAMARHCRRPRGPAKRILCRAPNAATCSGMTPYHKRHVVAMQRHGGGRATSRPRFSRASSASRWRR
jgi:hypothetical protein